MDGELMPQGGHHKKADPAYAQKLREGGKKAQQIARDTHAQHQKEDIPQAEEQLLKDLATIEDSRLKSKHK